jgi:hypothetical protein
VTSSISYTKLPQEVDSIYCKYRVITNYELATPHFTSTREEQEQDVENDV